MNRFLLLQALDTLSLNLNQTNGPYGMKWLVGQKINNAKLADLVRKSSDAKYMQFSSQLI